MKCRNCEKGELMECPECKLEVVLCREEGDIEILPGYFWDEDFCCYETGDGEEDASNR